MPKEQYAHIKKNIIGSFVEVIDCKFFLGYHHFIK